MAIKKQSLSVTHPDLAAQADGWDPSLFTFGSELTKSWHCNNNHSWDATISSRVRGSSCPFCSGKVVLVGFNDLKTTHPSLAAEAHGWDPTTLTAKSKKKRAWECQYGHVWDAEVRSRSVIGASCPFCDGRRAIPGVNDLGTLHPLVAAQAHNWDPSVINPNSHKKLEFICVVGHVCLQEVRRRVEATGCPVCQNDRVLVGYNDLATTHPELAAEAHGWDPTTVTAGTHKKLKWKCSLEHTWTTGLINRTKDGTGCPSCSGRVAIPGETDLATTHPELAAQAVGWDPTTVKAGTSTKKLKWGCVRGHEWLSTPSTRAGLGTGCPYCSGLRVIVGETDLATTHPELAKEADGWDPTTVGKGGGRKRWKCPSGHSYLATVHNRSYMNSGCPSCAKYGFDPNKEAWLYFIDHDELQMFQVGISNVPNSRLGKHSKRGWDVLEVRGPMKGQLAKHLESAILLSLERRGAILGSKAGLEKFDGYSEAWTKSSLMVSNIRQLLDWVYEDENPPP